jgi:hypothetical protein
MALFSILTLACKRKSNQVKSWVRIKKPVVTFGAVSYYRQAVCPDLFATLPNYFANEILIRFANNC